VHYCRETARNPWYAYVHRQAGLAAVPEDWRRRRTPFGLGPRGCEIRAGRYVFCYSYNCRRLLESLRGNGGREAFQQLSDLLLPVNRLPGGRLLHEPKTAGSLTAADLAHITTSVDLALARLTLLEPLLVNAHDEPTAAPYTPQDSDRSFR
jgi:hypothetical protein